MTPIYFDNYEHDYKLPGGQLKDSQIWLKNSEYIKLLDALGVPDAEKASNIASRIDKYFQEENSVFFNIAHYDAEYENRLNRLNMLKYLSEFCKQVRNLRTGENGEEEVYKRLTDSGDGWKAIRNINIPYQNGSTEIDMVLFANGHIFIIEIKNYHFKHMTFTKDGSVKGLDDNGGDPERNLLTQIEDHEVAVRKCLLNNTDLTVDQLNKAVHSMIVIANNFEGTTVSNETNIPIVKMVMARRAVVDLTQERVLTDKELDTAMNTLTRESLPDKEFPFQNPFIWQSRLQDVMEFLRSKEDKE